MRKTTLALTAVVGLCVVAQTAAAQTRQWQFGPEVGLGTDNVGASIGARAVFRGLGAVTKVTGLAAYASFDYFFPNSSRGPSPSYWEINVNGTWDIRHVTGPFKPYVGAGIDYGHWSERGGSHSNSGLNLLGGTRINPAPNLRLFGELRFELRTNPILAVTVGMLF